MHEPRFTAIFLLLASFLLPWGSIGQVVNQIAPIHKNITGKVAGGYIFITQTTLDSANAYPSALSILDSIGNPVFFKPFAKQTTGPFTPSGISDFKLQPSGFLSYSKANSGMYLLDSHFLMVDSIKCVNGITTDGHDLVHLPDGSFHLVGTEERIMDLSGIQTMTGTPGSATGVVTGNVIQRFDAQKNLKFEWKSLDHFAISDAYKHFFTDPSKLDHSHYNSLEVDYDGNYILSFRHLHEITKIDSGSGQIIWRLGGKNNQFNFLGDTTTFTAQHDARRLANGNLTLFDNATHSNGSPARAMEYNLDEVNMTAIVTWQFKEPNTLTSAFIGNAQRLPNENTLIDWGGAFPLSQSTSFTEVDNSGTVVMELDFVSDRYVSYRAVKSKLPFALTRPEITCDPSNLTLTAPAGHSYYEWSNGATTQTITVADTGLYQVWVNRGIGFVSSTPYHISDLNSICNPTGMLETRLSKIRVFPNPAQNKLYIQFEGTGAIPIQIITSSGQVAREASITFDGNTAIHSLDIGQLSPGLYILRVENSSIPFVKNP